MLLHPKISMQLRGPNKVIKPAEDLPSLTEADRKRPATLVARPDSETDLSDMPELTGEDWKTAVRSKHYRPVKAQITVHLVKDVLAWLKSDGLGYPRSGRDGDTALQDLI